MDRRKELKQQYRQMKPQMGVFAIRSNSSSKCYIEGTQDLKSALNSARFKLEFGNHPNRELQQEWKEYGETDFVFDVLDVLEYHDDESKTDYTEELALLRMMWKEKLSKGNVRFYKQ